MHPNNTLAAIASQPVPPSKRCPQCQETKPASAFNSYGRGRGRMPICGRCRNKGRKGRQETPEQRLKRKLREEYRLTLAEYEALVEVQGGACAICKAKPQEGKRLSIDHCHTTGKVRALLCTYCNVAVGFYENRGQDAIKYLAEYGDGHPVLAQ